MRIGLDGFPLLTPLTGVGHYTFELARALALLAPSDLFELIAPSPFPSSIIEDIRPICAPLTLKPTRFAGGVGGPLVCRFT